MTHCLEQLFELEYEEIFPTSPQCKTLKRQAYPMYEQIHQTLGVDFADHLSQLHGDMEELSGRLLFQRGFYLGTRLMLDVLEHGERA